jgi:hypothetical protein
MSQYFFIIQWAGLAAKDDEDGTTLANDSEAFEYAQRIIRELKKDGGYDDPGLTMTVRNDAGATVLSIPF